MSRFDERDDAELVGAVRAGSMEAFGELYSRKAGMVLGFLSRRTRDRDLCRDLAQDTFVRALQGVTGFTAGNVDAWLLRIARNLLVDHSRRASTRYEMSVAEVRDEADDDGDPERHVLAAEQADLWRAQATVVFSALTEPPRACLQQRFGEQCDVNETAGRMHRSPGAVRVLQHRAMHAALRAVEVGVSPQARPL